ncbi:hypothetical protein RclHR1_00080025 [Rhizophagus clarus]|uniref:MULE transposase domain-containing protein n=1 Tax=Rhizophagus clarus TaxID=94130 RepID=A0A2Z6RYW2_9GLOM|nr:hypothetical protein RclHR1_00080025 [Rhizophagus clarus]
MNRVVCDIIKSTQGNLKINIHGYFCSGRAITDLEGEEHILISTKEHSHAPQASRADVAKALEILKGAASNTHDQPAQIIQDTVINMRESSYSYMPNKQALGKQISRVRNKEGPSQPQTLDQINVPMELRRTIKDAGYWIMDGTFKTVPILFLQMYTIHALVGGESNARVLPMIYALMTGKSEECYNRLFEELIDLAEEADFILNPPLILTDFEQAAINAAQNQHPESIHKCCYFHLCQNFWKKIQALGLAIEYTN